MFKIIRAFAALGSLLFTNGAFAELPFQAGDEELVFSAFVENESSETRFEPDGGGSLLIEDEDTTFAFGSVGWGFFLDERQEITPLGTLVWVDSDDLSYWYVLGGLAYDLHFPQADSTLVPVVGAVVQRTLFGNTDLTQTRYGVNGGVRVLAGPSISVNVRVYYEISKVEDESLAGATVVTDVDNVGVRFGFSWLMR